MLFKKKKEHHEDDDASLNMRLALTSLVPLCSDGLVKNDAFVLEDKDIYVYADVVSLRDNVAQIVYQLHHGWLDEPIMESMAAVGTSLEDAIHQAAASFYENVLSLYIQAVEQPISAQRVRVMTGEPHDYYIYRGHINGVGEREGILEGDFWDMLQEEIPSCLSNQKAHWVKIFTSRNKDNIICEVRINNKEISSLSEKMIRYAENWVCKDDYHTEKQGILLVQDTGSYVEYEYSKDEIIMFTDKAIAMFDACLNREDYLDIRKSIYKMTKDESLTHEIFFLIPELYCMYAYPEVEFGEKLFLVRKNEKTREIQRSQLFSFTYINEAVERHFRMEKPTEDILERVLQFSANARAIEKAVGEGCAMEELLIPGMGILIPKDYKLR